ncbi:DUF1015 domain-containing protein [Nitrospira sp. Kam-Ns4a]
MANLIPFRGVLYNSEVVGDVAKVVAPPYDVIDAEAQRVLHARHPHNVIRLELGLDEPGDGPARNKYTRAAAWLRDWLVSGALRRDPEPAIYPYTIEYRAPSVGADTAVRVLKGFLATVQLEEFGTGRIYPHENTRAAAKADRLRLLEACRANFSPIFSLFSDPEDSVLSLIQKSVNTEKPRLDFRDDEGFRQRLWTITDPAVLREIAAAMQPKPLFIADGHHRYETALTYRRQRREAAGLPPTGGDQPYDRVLMLFACLEDPGLTVLPTHRALKLGLPGLGEITSLLREAFTVECLPFTPESEAETRAQFLRKLRAAGEAGQAFGLALEGADCYLLLTLKAGAALPAGAPARDRLDVSVLHNLLLPTLRVPALEEADVLYTKDDREALELVRRGEARAAFLLNPTKVSEVRAVAAAGGRMPHKSTYFFPKPLTGLVLHLME